MDLNLEYNQTSTESTIENSNLFQQAFLLNDLETINKIFDNISIPVQKQLAQKILLSATQINKINFVKFSLSKGANPNKVDTDLNLSPLNFAVENKSKEILDLFKKLSSAENAFSFFKPNVKPTLKLDLDVVVTQDKKLHRN